MAAPFGGMGTYGPESMDDKVLIVLLIVYFGIIFLAWIYSAVSYVLQSLGLFTIARRRRIHHPWLAWIPIAGVWTFGAISDHYQYMVKGKEKKRRKILLGLLIALYAFTFAWVIAMYIPMVMSIVSGEDLQVLPFMLIMTGGYVVLLALVLIAMIFQYLAYFDLFASCDPDKAPLRLVLGMLFPFLLPFFIFACRGKDLGMQVQNYIIPADPGPIESGWKTKE